MFRSVFILLSALVASAPAPAPTSVAVDAARASYLAGRGDFTTVAQDFQLWLDARAQLARREADRYLAWAELAQLTQPIAPQERTQP